MRHEIEQTRGHMSGTIDAIADRTSPRRIAGRQRQRMSDRVHSIRETVMGSAETAYGGTQDQARGVAESAQRGAEVVADEVRHAPEQVRRQTQGNPLAAGLVAFGGGLLAATVIPSTRAERQVATRLQEEAQPAIAELEHAGQEVAEEVKTTAQHAAQDVKETASESARHVAEEAKGSAQQVQQQARTSAERVAGDAKQAAQEVRDGSDDEPSRSELYERAQQLDVPGRSQMTKSELAEAVESAERAP